MNRIISIVLPAGYATPEEFAKDCGVELVQREIPLVTSDDDEALMRTTLQKCYGTKMQGFRVSAEHYRYLAEQIVALREHIKRMPQHEAQPSEISLKKIAARISCLDNTIFKNTPENCKIIAQYALDMAGVEYGD